MAFPEYVVPVPELSGPSYIVKISAFSCVLKRKVMKEGLVKEIRDRQFYKKPSEIKQEKKKEAIKNWKKKQKKLAQTRGF